MSDESHVLSQFLNTVDCRVWRMLRFNDAFNTNEGC